MTSHPRLHLLDRNYRTQEATHDYSEAKRTPSKITDNEMNSSTHEQPVYTRHLKSMAPRPMSIPVSTVASSRNMMAPSA